jgi:hypothetical protein
MHSLDAETQLRLAHEHAAELARDYRRAQRDAARPARQPWVRLAALARRLTGGRQQERLPAYDA